LEKFLIFPNPSRSSINISSNFVEKEFEVEILNMNGQVLINDKLFGKFNKINISYLERGIYFVRIKSNGKIRHVKIVKE
jgi:hypothetical protein